MNKFKKIIAIIGLIACTSGIVAFANDSTTQKNPRLTATTSSTGWSKQWYPSHACGIKDNHTTSVGRSYSTSANYTVGESKIQSGSKLD